MAGTKLVREERVPTVEIAAVAHGDRALDESGSQVQISSPKCRAEDA
jgi:hypothetical protein